ncbi:MAG: M48 family metalloprotease [Lentisphaeria bacterium]
MFKQRSWLGGAAVVAGAGACLLPLLSGCASLSDGMRAAAGAAGSLPVDLPLVQDAARATQAGANLVYHETGPLQEYQLGRGVTANLLGAYRPVAPREPVSRYVARVGAVVAAGSDSPYPYNGYRFIVVDTPEINAFAAPGGFIVVTTGMLRFLRSEDELAVILGHEVGHVELQHAIRDVGRENWVTFLDASKNLALEQQDPQAVALLNRLTGEMAGKIRQGYSVDFEAAADRRAMAICGRAGYDGAALPVILERFKAKTGTYGGANYPQQRGDLARQYLQTLGGMEPASPARTARYQLATAGR